MSVMLINPDTVSKVSCYVASVLNCVNGIHYGDLDCDTINAFDFACDCFEWGCKHYSAKTIFDTLSAMNVAAWNERYHENLSPDSEFKEISISDCKCSGWNVQSQCWDIGLELFQVLKNLQAIIYNIGAEQKYYVSKEFEKSIIDALKNITLSIQNFIICNDPRYTAASWT